VSAVPQGATPATAPERCPRCSAPLHREQDWCLQCGAAVHTRLVPTPPWRAPVALVAALVALALVLLAVAFVALTRDAGPTTTTTTPQTTQAPAPAQP